VLHVDGAAPPDVAFVDVAGEGRARPRLGLDGDDVEVCGQQQRRLFARTLQARDHVLALGGLADERRRQPRPREEVGEVLGRRRLVARRVGRVDAQKRLQVPDRLVAEIGRRYRRRSHWLAHRRWR
jgi:hypothetical protein